VIHGLLMHRTQQAHAEALSNAFGSAWLSRQTNEFRQSFLEQASIQTASVNKVIIGLHDEDHPLYFLHRGCIEVSIPRPGDELAAVHFIQSGSWFGEHGALSGRNGIAEYRAHKPCTLLALPRRALASHAHAEHVMQAMVDLMSLNFRTYLDITGTLMEQRPEHRVQSRILTLLSGEGNVRTDGAIILPLSQEELASLCCVSRPTVNKILRQMEALGWVDLGYRCIKITNLNAIRNSCGAVTA